MTKYCTFKTIIFNTIEEAERFVKLYGGIHTTSFASYEYRYYGDKIRGKAIVSIRNSKEDMNEIIKSIGIKKRKYNGKTIYVYE